MAVIDRVSLRLQLRWMVVAAGVILIALAVGWFATRAADRASAARCAQMYDRARNVVDTLAVDREIVPDTRTEEGAAGGVLCGTLRALGRMR